MRNVLAVDDDKDILYTLEAISEAADFNIVTTCNGQDLLDMINLENFSLIIIDYYMPNINGLDLVKQIRKSYFSIPILILTVDESVDLAREFIEAGATDFANKPIKAADLISRINLHLDIARLQCDNENYIDNLAVPKGMSRLTFNLVYNYLREKKTFQTIEEISSNVGLAYQTVHRYLICMEKKNLVSVQLKYGEVGRPIHYYSFKDRAIED